VHILAPAIAHSEVSQKENEVSIQAVSSARDRDRFIEFQIDLYRDDFRYVPPIVAERRDFLDKAKNPFLAHAEVEMFLALRNGEVVGRIAAIDDSNYNQFHNSETGFFGMFECIDDVSVARPLFSAAAAWVAQRGMKQMVGPVNFSTNYECGVLVEGFDHPSVMMMAYNYSYYPKLYEASGFRKAKDLWAYASTTSLPPPEHAVEAAEKLKRQGVRVRPLRIPHLSDDVRAIKTIYDAMLEPQWGYVPMSDDEFEYMTARLRPLVHLRPELCFIVEYQGEPVAFSITFPDGNGALKAAGGHLSRFGLPLGLARMIWAMRKVDRLRVLFLGVKPGLKLRGLDTLLYLETMRAARDRGFSRAEIGWILEDDHALNRAVESMGARRYKTFRLYEREV
jgi:hypothetical protein